MVLTPVQGVWQKAERNQVLAPPLFSVINVTTVFLLLMSLRLF